MLTMLMLLGCPYVSEPEYEEVRDVDGDGVEAIRFGGRDCDDNDASLGDCDTDRDGVQSIAAGGQDCDDTNAAIRPDAEEICDGVDNDCDGLVDDADQAVGGRGFYYLDSDGDGYGTGDALRRCNAPQGTVELDGDCDDGTPTVNPGVAEQCDGVDWNCDGDPQAGAVRDWFADEDGDGFGDPLVLVASACERPDDSAVPNPFDCDDGAADAHPASVQTGLQDEVCDGIDNDCDGLFDLDDPDLDETTATLGYPDVDGDGFGDANAPVALTCFAATLDGTDCDDTDAEVHPGASERCDTAGDDDCDGLLNTNDPDNDGLILWFADVDGDGVGSTTDPRAVCTDDGVQGHTPVSGDCNDLDGTITTAVDWYLDTDADGYGTDGDAITSCFPVVGRARQSGDCNDSNNAVRPDAQELCDTVDNDCNGVVDDDAPGALVGWPDADGDGFGDASADPGPLCTQTVAVVSNGLDCHDEDAAIAPGQPEDCNGPDRDCDGLDDEEDPDIVLDVWYRDQDLDGFGEIDGPTLEQCDAPLGYVQVANDCNDDDAREYFATYYGASDEAASTSGVRVNDLKEVLVNPGRCRPDVDGFFEPDIALTVVELDPAELFIVSTANDNVPDDVSFPRIDAYTTIALRAPIGERATVCWDPSTSLEIVGGLELERVDLVFGTPNGSGGCEEATAVPASPFVLIGHESSNIDHGTWSRVLLSDTTISGGPFQAPFARSQPEDIDALNLLSEFTLERTDLLSLTFEQGIVDIADFAVDLRIREARLDGITSNDAVFRLGHRANIDQTPTFDDVEVTGSSFEGAFVEYDGPTNRYIHFDSRRLNIHDTVVDGPMFCLGEAGCASEVALAPFETMSLELIESQFLDVLQTDGSTTPLAHLSAGVQLTTDDLRGKASSSSSSGPWVHYIGAAAPDHTGWEARRDRLAGDLGGLEADGLAHQLTNVHLVDAFPLRDPTGSATLTGVSVVGASIELDVADAHLAGVVLVDADLVPDAATTVHSPDNGFAPVYTIGTDTSSFCASQSCTGLHPSVDPVDPDVDLFPTLVSFADGMDPERMVPFPKLPWPSGNPFATTAPNADPALFFDDTQWSLDPNTDGLPTAWLQLQGADPSCWDAGFDLFRLDDASTPEVEFDIDGDGFSNQEEAAAGSWPCIAESTPSSP